MALIRVCGCVFLSVCCVCACAGLLLIFIFGWRKAFVVQFTNKAKREKNEEEEYGNIVSMCTHYCVYGRQFRCTNEWNWHVISIYFKWKQLSAAVAAAAVLTNWNGWQQTSKKLSAHELINFNAFLSAYKMDQFLLYTSSHLLSTWITLRLYGFKRNKG